MSIFTRIKTWAVGPGGWLADSDKDEECAAIDAEIDKINEEVRRQCHLQIPDYENRSRDLDEWINRLRNQHRDGEDHPT